MKFGKKPASAPRVRPLRHLLRMATLPHIPERTDRAPLVTRWGMLANDVVGDCVEAGGCHAVDLMTAVAGRKRSATANDALAIYQQFGYVPGNPSTDNGTDLQDFLAGWAQRGYEIGGATDHVAGFQSLSPTDLLEVKEAIAWLGCALVGLALPASVAAMEEPGVPFDVPTGQSLSGEWAYGSAGGHCVLIADYDPDGFTVVTWGMTKRMTNRFWLAYGDEAYAVLDRDFASPAIPGQAWRQLEAEMAGLQAR